MVVEVEIVIKFSRILVFLLSRHNLATIRMIFDCEMALLPLVRDCSVVVLSFMTKIKFVVKFSSVSLFWCSLLRVTVMILAVIDS